MKMVITIAVANVLAISLTLVFYLFYTKSDQFYTMEERCAANGFRFESYNVVTSDDYVLSLYRIPGTFQESQDDIKKKPAVLLMHCLNCDMMEWIWNDSDRATAFILARAGYDVWMGNNRGSKFSLGHLTKDIS